MSDVPAPARVKVPRLLKRLLLPLTPIRSSAWASNVAPVWLVKTAPSLRYQL
jgi:hypothetical protein